MELAQYTPYTIQRIYQLPVGTVVKFIELPCNFDSLIKFKYIAPSGGGWFVVKQSFALSTGITLYFAGQYSFLTGHWFKRCDGVKQDCEAVKTSSQDVESNKPIDSYVSLWQRDYWQL